MAEPRAGRERRETSSNLRFDTTSNRSSNSLPTPTPTNNSSTTSPTTANSPTAPTRTTRCLHNSPPTRRSPTPPSKPLRSSPSTLNFPIPPPSDDLTLVDRSSSLQQLLPLSLLDSQTSPLLVSKVIVVEDPLSPPPCVTESTTVSPLELEPSGSRLLRKWRRRRWALLLEREVTEEQDRSS